METKLSSNQAKIQVTTKSKRQRQFNLEPRKHFFRDVWSYSDLRGESTSGQSYTVFSIYSQVFLGRLGFFNFHQGEFSYICFAIVFVFFFTSICLTFFIFI